MKASRWNTTDPPGRTVSRWVGSVLLSVGALGTGLLGSGGFDLVYEPFGSIMVFSQTVGLLAALAVFYHLVLPRLAPRPVLVRVRR
jgi:uncharacterized membrane protein YuzA (DUF378 family)